MAQAYSDPTRYKWLPPGTADERRHAALLLTVGLHVLLGLITVVLPLILVWVAIMGGN